MAASAEQAGVFRVLAQGGEQREGLGRTLGVAQDLRLREQIAAGEVRIRRRCVTGRPSMRPSCARLRALRMSASGTEVLASISPNHLRRSPAAVGGDLAQVKADEVGLRVPVASAKRSAGRPRREVPELHRQQASPHRAASGSCGEVSSSWAEGRAFAGAAAPAHRALPGAATGFVGGARDLGPSTRHSVRARSPAGGSGLSAAPRVAQSPQLEWRSTAASAPYPVPDSPVPPGGRCAPGHPT